MRRSAWKKFQSRCLKHKVEEFCLQSWCLLCMETTRVEEKCNMKYSSLCNDVGYIIVFVHVFELTVFVESIKYIDLQNLQRGVLETCVIASNVLCATAFPLSIHLKMSSGSYGGASSAPPPPPPLTPPPPQILPVRGTSQMLMQQILNCRNPMMFSLSSNMLSLHYACTTTHQIQLSPN